ncbi:MAG: SMP-30/gluconolactonase/LRE family protein [Syntrophomonadaceae bacterium]
MKLNSISRSALLITAVLISNSFTAAQSPFGENARAEKVIGGFQFVEGPLWKDNLGLLFSDINGNTIYRWSPDNGVSVFLKPTGNSNGLAFDIQGRLLFAQQGGRKLMRLEADGKQTVLAEYYQGKRLNSPNDIAVKSDGSIYFTDPPYGISKSQEELGFYGVYRISPNGELQLIEKTISRPNGIAFSPDEKKLYVGDAENRRIFVYELRADTIISKKQFAYISPAGYVDGMKTDSSGNLYAAGPLGIWVFSPGGAVLDTVFVPGQTTNCIWGDSDRRTLYITSGSDVYRVRFKSQSTGIKEDSDKNNNISSFGCRAINSQILFSNYPNPFNPATNINYSIATGTNVRIEILDLLGNRIRTLVNEYKKSGSYQVKFDAGGLSSGIYLYRIETDRSNASGKLLLAK